VRILMVTNHIPYPPFSGNPLRNYNLLRRIAMEHEVWLATFVRSAEEVDNILHLLKFCKVVEIVEMRQVGALERPIEGIHYLLKGIPPELRLYQNEEMTNKIQGLVRKTDFDVVQIEDSYMGLYLRALPVEMHARTVLTFHDVVFSKFDRISRLEPKLARKMRLWLYSQMMRRWEPFYAERFGGCIAMSDSDRDLLQSANPHLKIDVIPNGVDINFYQPLPSSNHSPALIFVGNMEYRPNIDAMAYFCRDIYPKIQREIVDLEMWIVGINPSPEVIQLEGKGVHVTGGVEDVRPLYSQSTVCVVPLRAGGGTRLKILEAMALGRPVVSTSIGCEGIEVVDGEHLFIADTPDQFAEKTISLLKNKRLTLRITAQARELVVNRYDWEVITRQLLQVYSRLIRRSSIE
jgi:sugar transferase (PEP-CTERM/EpsH1 system associated)